MSDHDPTDGPLDPAREDAVRRLLAEARHDEPLPPEVAARLDVLIGRLADERAAGVGSLAAQREKRTRRRGLLLVAAAAAVVAVAVGPRITGGGDSMTSADSSASDSDSASDSGGSAEAASPFAAQEQPAPEASAQTASALVLTSDGFRREVRRVLLGGVPAPSSPQDESLTRLTDGCALPPGVPYADLYPATYDGRPALLGASIAVLGRQTATLYLCGETDAVRSVTVDLTR